MGVHVELLYLLAVVIAGGYTCLRIWEIQYYRGTREKFRIEYRCIDRHFVPQFHSISKYTVEIQSLTVRSKIVQDNETGDRTP